MKHFLKKVLALVLGCALVGGGLFAFVYCNDFNGFFGNNEEYNPDNPTGKMALYRKTPLENIIIGDSRLNEMRHLGEYIEDISGEEYFNIAFGGASQLDSANLFWYCDALTELKKVYIAVSFYRMQANDHEDRVPIVQKQFDEPLTYMFSLRTLETSWKMFRERIAAHRDAASEPTAQFEEEAPVQQPTEAERADAEAAAKQSKAEKTQELIDLMYGLCTYREGYALNENAMQALIEVAQHCTAEGIELIFVALPSHPEVYRQIIEPLELEPYIEEYKNTLAQYAPVYDMEFYSDFSQSADNFRDALHLEPAQHERFLHAMLTADDPMVRIIDHRHRSTDESE